MDKRVEYSKCEGPQRGKLWDLFPTTADSIGDQLPQEADAMGFSEALNLLRNEGLDARPGRLRTGLASGKIARPGKDRSGNLMFSARTLESCRVYLRNARPGRPRAA